MQGGTPQKKDASGGARKSSKDSKHAKDKESKDTKEPSDSKHSKDHKTKHSKDPRSSLKEGGSKDSKDSTGSKEKKEEKRSDAAKNPRATPNSKEPKGSAGQESPSRKERAQAKASFPLTRIKMIMKSAPEVNTLGVDAVALTARAAELFVVHLAKETLKKGKSTKVDYADIYKVVHDNQDLDFLYDIIPQKMPYKDCIAEMKETERKQKEIMDQIEI